MPSVFNYQKYLLLKDAQNNSDDIIKRIDDTSNDIYDYTRQRVPPHTPETEDYPYLYPDLLGSLRDLKGNNPERPQEANNAPFVNPELNDKYHGFLDYLNTNYKPKKTEIKKEIQQGIKTNKFTPEETLAAKHALDVLGDPYLVARKAFEYLKTGPYKHHFEGMTDPFLEDLTPSERERDSELLQMFKVRNKTESVRNFVNNKDIPDSIKAKIFYIYRERALNKIINKVKEFWAEYQNILSPEQFAYIVTSLQRASNTGVDAYNIPIDINEAYKISDTIRNLVDRFNLQNPVGSIISGSYKTTPEFKANPYEIPFIDPNSKRISLSEVISKSGFNFISRGYLPSRIIDSVGQEAKESIEREYADKDTSNPVIEMDKKAAIAEATQKAEHDKAVEILKFAIVSGGYEKGGLSVLLNKSLKESRQSDTYSNNQSDLNILNIFQSYCQNTKEKFKQLLADAGYEYLQSDVDISKNIPDKHYFEGYGLQFQSIEEGDLVDKMRSDFGLLAIPYRLGIPAPEGCLTNNEMIVDFILNANVINGWTTANREIQPRNVFSSINPNVHPEVAPNIVFVGEYFGFDSKKEVILDSNFTYPGSDTPMMAKNNTPMTYGNTVTQGDLYDYKTTWKKMIETFYAHMIGGKTLFLSKLDDNHIITQLDNNNILYKHKSCSTSNPNTCIPTKLLLSHYDVCNNKNECSGCQYLAHNGFVNDVTINPSENFVPFFNPYESDKKTLSENYINAAIAHLTVKDAASNIVEKANLNPEQKNMISDNSVYQYYTEYEEKINEAKKIYLEYIYTKNPQLLNIYYKVYSEANKLFNDKFSWANNKFKEYQHTSDEYKTKQAMLETMKKYCINAKEDWMIQPHDIRNLCNTIIKYPVDTWLFNKINEIPTARKALAEFLNPATIAHWYKPDMLGQ